LYRTDTGISPGSSPPAGFCITTWPVPPTTHTIEQAIEQMRSGPALAEPDRWVLAQYCRDQSSPWAAS
jgi:hypothetical protein